MSRTHKCSRTDGQHRWFKTVRPVLSAVEGKFFCSCTILPAFAVAASRRQVVPSSGASIAPAARKRQHEMLQLQEILFALRTRGTLHVYKERPWLVSRSLSRLRAKAGFSGEREGWRLFSTFPSNLGWGGQLIPQSTLEAYGPGH